VCNKRTVFILFGVIAKLPVKFLSELVVLASGNITLIDIVVHVNEKVLVGAVEERHSTGCDITIESSQSPENHVVVHEQSIQFHDELNATP
jgi:hypothetical protein